ncbi:hypothetical protein N9996_03915 [Synechococcus sp. AH-603-M21]|nr:hypothetical protein [Synechococcus sp. AH-603-M21]
MEGIEMKKTDYDQDTYYKRVEKDLKPLILITLKAEELIADYALVKTEDLWDEEYDQVVRALFFEQGDREYIISITPHGLIRRPHSKYPSRLSTQLHNVVVGLYAGGWMTDKINPTS